MIIAARRTRGIDSDLGSESDQIYIEPCMWLQFNRHLHPSILANTLARERRYCRGCVPWMPFMTPP